MWTPRFCFIAAFILFYCTWNYTQCCTDTQGHTTTADFICCSVAQLLGPVLTLEKLAGVAWSWVSVQHLLQRYHRQRYQHRLIVIRGASIIIRQSHSPCRLCERPLSSGRQQQIIWKRGHQLGQYDTTQQQQQQQYLLEDVYSITQNAAIASSRTVAIWPCVRPNRLNLAFLADLCNATFGYCHNMSSVCRLSVTRMYCDKTAAVRIMQFSLKCCPMR